MKCKDCKFWEAFTREKGQCRVNAPHIRESTYEGCWPTTFANDWCGKFIAEESLSAAPTAAETTERR